MKALIFLPLFGLLLGCGSAPNGGDGKKGEAAIRNEAREPARPDLQSGPKAAPGVLPAEDTEIGGLVPDLTRSEPYYCGEVGFIDLGSAVDGPAYYFRRRDGAVIGRCGGLCMTDMPAGRCARECPPVEWICRPVPERPVGASLAKPERRR